ncbi:MAG: electron transfer flavoprotein subunit alpha/FixB family protein [Deltaproteobacteria bacterium]|nr:electron transfer flavoprotein subunit alpha/FixB family protein [Deltaproteobacteria bacterium]
MSNVLIVCEVKNAEPKKSTLELLSKGKEIAGALGGSLSAVAIGSGLGGFADKVAPYGAAKVYVADGAAEYSTEGFTKIIADAVAKDGAGVVLFSAGSQGKDLAPRLAARLEAAFATDCVDIGVDGGKVTVKRPVFAGKAFAHIAMEGSPAVVGLRPNSFPVAEPAGGTAETVALPADFGDVKAKVVEVVAGESSRPDLTEAERIVSGGRAMKEAANFKILEELADVIGATVGASRAAVDSGYAPQSRQVGQTGKTVNPVLYMAFGISGAIQHLAGMRTSKVIVAVNKDPEAPIFQKADYGIVADLFEVVPKMTEEFKKLLAEG